jgi:hypothetical protein
MNRTAHQDTFLISIILAKANGLGERAARAMCPDENSRPCASTDEGTVIKLKTGMVDDRQVLISAGDVDTETDIDASFGSARLNGALKDDGANSCERTGSSCRLTFAPLPEANSVTEDNKDLVL